MGRIDFRKKLSLVLIASAVAGNIAFADTAKNCITDVKLNNDGNNVKVNIYTDKPYSDSVVVSKKEGNKYVILVPETASSMKSAPKVTGSNVHVSMQTINAGKGYTKITITSDKSVNIIPKTITATHSATKQTTQPQKTVQTQTSNQKSNTSTKTTQTKATDLKQTQKQKTVKSEPQKATKTTKPVEKNIVKSTKTQIPQQAQDVSKNKPMQILEQEVKTDKVKEVINEKADALLEKTIKDNDKIIKERKLKKRKKKPVIIIDQELGIKQSIKLVLQEAQELSIWKLLMLAGAITFPLIVILIILNLDKKINKKINSMKKEDDVEVIQKALRESVQNVREQKAKQLTESNKQSYNSIDEMLDKVEDTETVADGYSNSPIEPEIINQEIPENVPIDTSDFEIETEEVQLKETQKPEFIEQNEPIIEELSSTDDLEEKTLLPTTPENVEISPNDDSILENYNPDGVLADYSDVNDKEFFDELVMQSLAETSVNSLPENTPADEIFSVMTEDESGVNLSDFQNNSNYDDVEDTENNEPDNDDLTMLKEVKINDNTGLYLVNYDNFSSLVGHVADDYFVIKKFDGIVNGNIILKQAEKSQNSVKYLVRVGGNKMIVQVDDKSMSRLIDL